MEYLDEVKITQPTLLLLLLKNMLMTKFEVFYLFFLHFSREKLIIILSKFLINRSNQPQGLCLNKNYCLTTTRHVILSDSTCLIRLKTLYARKQC